MFERLGGPEVHDRPDGLNLDVGDLVAWGQEDLGGAERDDGLAPADEASAAGDLDPTAVGDRPDAWRGERVGEGHLALGGRKSRVGGEEKQGRDGRAEHPRPGNTAPHNKVSVVGVEAVVARSE